MKIGIITITEGENLGNRLQNYAVQQYIEKNLGIKPETIRNYKSFKIYKYVLKNWIIAIKRYIKILLLKERISSINRIRNFKKFNRKNINYSKYIISNVSINLKINKSYDYFICGSDQIWNPNYEENSYVNFLQFADKNKRIAFAPSFGTSNINDKMKDNYSRWLKEIPKLSVREDRGKELIEEMTGRKDVEVLVDPTMLLTKEEWEKITIKPKNLKTDKYILNYFLGDLSDKRKKEIERVAKENNCQIINIFDKSSPFYEIGPSEFLYLEKNAFLVCTDSFHSCVFAILFNTPFIIFDREDANAKMNSRIDTLLTKFNLKDRWFKDKIKKGQLQIDYTEAYKILEKERDKAKKFIKNAIV